MAEFDDGDTPGRSAPTGRPSGASLIAELLSEQQAASPPPPPPPIDGRIGHQRPRRDRGDSKTGLVVAVLAVALLLGGGLGVFMASQGVGMTSKARFVARADAVCAPANGPVTALAKPTSYPELATAASTLVAATDTQLAGLRALKLPGGTDGGRAGAVLTALAETNHGGRSLQDAANRKDDTATATATQRVRASATEASAKAKELGLSACATGMQPGVEAVVGGAAGVVKTAFLAKADSVCRAGARELGAIREPRADLRDVVRYFNATMAISDRIDAEIKALPVPPGDEGTIADIVVVLDRMSEKYRQARDAAGTGDRSLFQALMEEMAVMVTAVDAKLDAYGLTSCGSNFGSR